MNHLLPLNLFLPCVLLLASCSEKNHTTHNKEISAELKKELIAVSYATTPIQSTLKSAEQTQQDFAASVKKNTDPDFLYIRNGIAISREQVIKLFDGSKITNARFYDQKFIRLNDTIVVQGLMDYSFVKKTGEIMELRNLFYCDVFARSNGQWLILTTVYRSEPVSPSVFQNESKQEPN